MTDKLQGQIRHVLTAGGGVLVALGLMTEQDAMSITDAVMAAAGAVIAAVGAVWSWWSKQ